MGNQSTVKTQKKLGALTVAIGRYTMALRDGATRKRKKGGFAKVTFLRYLEAADVPAGSVETCGPCRQYVAEACGHPGLRPLITPTCDLSLYSPRHGRGSFRNSGCCRGHARTGEVLGGMAGATTQLEPCSNLAHRTL